MLMILRVKIYATPPEKNVLSALLGISRWSIVQVWFIAFYNSVIVKDFVQFMYTNINSKVYF